MNKLEENLKIISAYNQRFPQFFKAGEIVALVHGEGMFIAPSASLSALAHLNSQISDLLEKPRHPLEEDNITVFTVA